MPPQANSSYPMGPSEVSFLFQSWASHQLLIYVGFCSGYHTHQWGLNHWGLHPCSPLEHKHCRHLCIMVMVIGSHQEFTEWLLHPLLQLEEPYATHSAVLKPFQQYGGVYSFGGIAESPDPSAFPHFKVWLHMITWLSLNLWWAFNPVILVWSLGIRLMSLLTPGMQSSLLPIHTFTLGLWIRCHPLTISHQSWGMRIIHFCTRQLQTLNRAWIQPRHWNETHPLMNLRSLLLFL